MTDIELKPCPACGGTNVYPGAYVNGAYVKCGDCNLWGPDNDFDGAKWNVMPRRTGQDVERLALLQQKVSQQGQEIIALKRQRDRLRKEVLEAFGQGHDKACDSIAQHYGFERSGDLYADLDAHFASADQEADLIGHFCRELGVSDGNSLTLEEATQAMKDAQRDVRDQAFQDVQENLMIPEIRMRSGLGAVVENIRAHFASAEREPDGWAVRYPDGTLGNIYGSREAAEGARWGVAVRIFADTPPPAPRGERCPYTGESAPCDNDPARVEAGLDAAVDDVFDQYGYAMRMMREDLKSAIRLLKKKRALQEANRDR